MSTINVIGIDWRPFIPNQTTHVGNPAYVMPGATRLVYSALDGQDPILNIADGGDLTLKNFVDAGGRHILIQASTDMYLGFGSAPVAGEAIKVAQDQVWKQENIGLLAGHLYILCAGTVVIQPFR